LTTPSGVQRIDVVSAQQMADAVERCFSDADMLVMAAAVADFSPAEPHPEKLKRGAIAGETLTLVLRKNPDILAAVAARKERRVVVGFALETTNGEAEARRKLEAKHLDLIVLNNPLERGAAFGEETNIVTLIGTDGPPERLPQLLKLDVANRILDRIRPRLG
jgi:phosphopantothenoylcysteine decarboxylase/phosphopantothenate--cysteine ligase